MDVSNADSFHSEETDTVLIDINTVVESLQAPFSAKFKKSQQQLVKTIEPVVDHIRTIHNWFSEMDETHRRVPSPPVVIDLTSQ